MYPSRMLSKSRPLLTTPQTAQVRAFGDITNAATDGDFTKLVEVEASGEMDELKKKINQMVYNLRDSIQRNTQAREEIGRACVGKECPV